MSRADGIGETKAIRRFLDTIRARPSYQRALEKGGAYIYSRS
jgi:glutathione S-transferase